MDKDYKKLYEEALKRAKKWYDANSNEGYREIFEDIFSELKESEDERIRKEIVLFLREGKPYYCPSSVKRQEWTNWLEKQGEQKSADKVEPKFKVGDIISDGVSEVEIVSIDKNKYSVTNSEIENDAHICNWVVDFKDQKKWKLVEYKSEENKKHSQSKQEWSEEDEEALNNIITAFKRIGENCEHYFSPDTAKVFEKTLKSLKDKIQPKQEWSEEDRERLLRIHQFIWANRKGDTDEIYQQEQDADWLKSLKPNHWKPSEQNIKDLEWCADLVKDKMGVGFHRLQVFIDELKNI